MSDINWNENWSERKEFVNDIVRDKYMSADDKKEIISNYYSDLYRNGATSSQIKELDDAANTYYRILK